MEKTVALKDTQAVASSSNQPLDRTADIEDESDQEYIIKEFPSLLSSTSLKRSSGSQVLMEDLREIKMGKEVTQDKIQN